MYVDDFKYHEISIEDNAGGTEAFHKPFFLLLNVAVAGNWPGFEVDDAQFPNEMLIDYIRVTQN
jgi:beta-glucanase (GH16 family)